MALQVSPSEVEGVLIEHPLITDVGVTSVPCEKAGELPQAWVVRLNDSLTQQMVIDYVKGIDRNSNIILLFSTKHRR